MAVIENWQAMIKLIWLYLKHSDLRITLNLNPLRWRVMFHLTTLSDMDPGLILHATFSLGPISAAITLDDGSW